ncbi:sigma-70 family RNA polymerase sigma factor [Streptomyces guryensis]|uniref:Sigma-70 family RNA polymerase sigma factor n=1 Tax=Streptomyces guryensis TaxID=2886947 RepID=A0A9Q3Z6F7_9ACTN|nr:sigma-70 family RNA polymerase sigma factor [Streptomyces guryensis]MCD9876118.1 sigma-70 family RNA polymerase sigma factor [Streptomyces guryensis]
MSDGSTAVSAPASASHAATAAYARIYEEQQPRLVAYARSLTRNAWTAEDLVAEAHFRVWRRLAAGHEIDNVPAYLMTTVRHLAIAAGSAVRETPRDPHGEERVETDTHPHADDPAERVSSVDLVVRVLGQLPERWVKALWLAEAEGQPLAAIGPQLGTKEGATAVLLHRAREGMRQAFLRTQTGAPDDPACQVYWARMPAYVRGAATAKQSERLLGHVEACDDCRSRLAALMSANDRLPALVGPALLVFVVGGAGKFLLAFTAGSAGAATAAGGHGGLLHGVRQVAVGGSKTQVAAAAGAVVAGAAALLLVLGPADAGRIPAQRTPVADAPAAQVPVAQAPAGPPSTGALTAVPKKDGTSAHGAGVQGSERARTHDTDRTTTAAPKHRDADEPAPAPAGDTTGGRTVDTPPPTGPAPTEPAPTEPAPSEPAPTEPAPTEPAPKGTDPAPPETGGTAQQPEAPPTPSDPYPNPPAPGEQPPAPPAKETPEPPAAPSDDNSPKTPAAPSDHTPEADPPSAPTPSSPPASEPEDPTPVAPEPVEDPAPSADDTGTTPVAPPAQDPSPATPSPTGTGPAAPPVSTPPADGCGNPHGSAGHGPE